MDLDSFSGGRSTPGTSNNTTVAYTYDPRGRVSNITTGSNQGGNVQNVQDLDYKYDGVGNVHSIQDNIVPEGQQPELTTFSYDELNRLTDASGAYYANYDYYPDGRMQTKAEGPTSEAPVETLGYGNSSHPDAVMSTTVNGNTTFSMGYDGNGNMRQNNNNGDTFTYNGNNQLVTRTSGGATITYTYDGQGNLVKESSSDGTSTVYIGGIYEKNSDGSWVDYYNAFGRRIAMRKHSGQSDPTGTVYYLLADTLGSTSTILNANGTVAQWAKYYPYGSMRSGGVTTTDKKFTGQQDEGTAFGLYDFGARFYSTVLGRFTSADPTTTGTPAMTVNECLNCGSKTGGKSGSSGGANANVAPDPELLDRYSYVKDNPTLYTDPTGLCFNNPFTGKPMKCGTRKMFILRTCAASGKACARLLGMSEDDPNAELMHRWAEYGVQTEEFKGNESQIWEPLSGPDRAEIAAELGHPELLQIEEGSGDPNSLPPETETGGGGWGIRKFVGQMWDWSTSRSFDCYFMVGTATVMCTASADPAGGEAFYVPCEAAVAHGLWACTE